MSRKHSNTTEAADDPLALDDVDAKATDGETPLHLSAEALEQCDAKRDTLIEIAVAAERERCAEIAMTVGIRPETYAERLQSDAVGAAIAKHIRSGCAVGDMPGNFDNAT